jgi:hypothetical protein
MSTIPAYMLAPIRTAEDGEAFLAALYAEGRLFHIDDCPSDVGFRDDDGRWRALFTDEEIPHMVQRMGELHSVPGYDPWESPTIEAELADGREEDDESDDDDARVY